MTLTGWMTAVELETEQHESVDIVLHY